MNTYSPRGFTLVESLVVVVVTVMLLAVWGPGCGTAFLKASQSARTTKDSTQVQQVHKAMLIYANEDPQKKLPVPGWIHRDQSAGSLPAGTPQGTPNAGRECTKKNGTRNLYSLCIMREMFNPDLLYGPTEVNSVVREAKNYDYSAYNPASGVFWDGDTAGWTCPNDNADNGNFRGKIYLTTAPWDENDGCHFSYSSLVLCGQRKKQYWRADLNPEAAHRIPLIGTRGTKNGATTGDDYTRSPTLQLHGDKQEWAGNICYGDNHVTLEKTFYPSSTVYDCGDGKMKADNIFHCEHTCTPNPSGAAAGDAWLGIVIGNPTDTSAAVATDALFGQ